jgi:hypothetical protein
MRRRAYGIDANHNQIVRDLEGLHYSVLNLAMVGEDCPDVLVGGNTADGRSKINVLVEIKTRTGQLTPGQREFQETWRGPRIVARSTADVLRAFGWTDLAIKHLGY